MNFEESFKSGLANYAVFEGRASRSEFWWFLLATNIAVVLASLADAITGAHGFLTFLVIAALLIPNISVQVRRLHDTGRSGWWILISLIPVVGLIALVIVSSQRGTAGTNEYGADPLGGPTSEGEPSAAAAARTNPPRARDLDQLERLHALLEKGALTQAEFDAVLRPQSWPGRSLRAGRTSSGCSSGRPSYRARPITARASREDPPKCQPSLTSLPRSWRHRRASRTSRG